MRSYNYLCDIFIFSNSLSQSTSSCTGRCHSIREAIRHHASIHFLFTYIRYSASSSVSISGISSLPRLIHQFTHDIASCLRELLTFKECCGLAIPVVVVLNKLVVMPPHVCQGCCVSWLLFMN